MKNLTFLTTSQGIEKQYNIESICTLKMENLKLKIKNNPESSLFLKLGLISIYNKKLDQASRCYEAAISLDPQNFMSFELQGHSFLGRGDLQKAAQAYSRAIDLSNNTGILRFFLAIALAGLGLRDEAINNFKQAIPLIPKLSYKLIWGTTPILNNKYFSEAMTKSGWISETLMATFYSSINKEADYDIYFEDLIPYWVTSPTVKSFIAPFLAFLYILENAQVLHIPCHGGPLGHTVFKYFEAELLDLAGIKVVVLPYGSDAYMYSKVIDPSLRHGLLCSYPMAGRNEAATTSQVNYWTQNADVMITGIMIDGIGRWDVTLPSYLSINIDAWSPKTSYSNCDGVNGLVKIIHTPNHRGFKGTEFLIQAVENLKNKGLKVQLILLEKVPNDKVREIMQEVDILAEQFIFTGYALSGIEGMASGLPVLSNLENETYTRLFRRYSFLNECPILSTSPETLEANLYLLTTNPDLRRQLGEAGRQYVEKYHSYETSQYMFGAVYRKILQGEDIDLMNLFHPVTSEFNKSKPYVQHPLTENRYLPTLIE